MHLKRPVILHFHTYKNAGSSVDAFLQSVFPGAWNGFDLHDVEEFFIHHSELVNIATNRPHLKAISSHQIRLPVPMAAKVEFLPIVFVRHPILRAASLWRFERGRADNHPRTIMAREHGFADWIAHALESTAARSFCEMQSSVFAFGMDQRIRNGDPAIPERAAANLAALPSVGVVEQFRRSMKIFEKLYAPKVPEFVYNEIERVNATGDIGIGLDDQLSEIRKEIGPDLFHELVLRNKSDLSLYQTAVSRLADQQVEDQ